MGRPSTMTNEIAETICEQLASGKSLRAICRELKLSESTVRYWLREDSTIFAQSARAKDLGYDALADECLEIADDPDIKPDDKRIRIDTRIRLLGKWSQRYSDKTETKHSGEVTSRHDLSNLNDDELAAFEQLAAKAAVTSGDQGRESTPGPDRVH